MEDRRAVMKKYGDPEDLSGDASSEYSRSSRHLSSSADNNNSNNHVAGGGGTDNNNVKILAQRETKVVQKLRILLGLILIAVIGIAIMGVIFLLHSYENQFEQEFEAQGTKMVEGFRSGSFNKLESLEALASSLTSYAMDANLTWPFVTVQNSAHFFESYVSLAKAAAIVVMPIIGERQRVEWEEYSVANQGWIDQDIQIRQETVNNEPQRALQYLSENDSFDKSISPYIKNYVGVDLSPGPWITWWQYSPVVANRWFVNFNRLAYANFVQEVNGVLDGKTAISKVRSFEQGLDLQSTRDINFMNDVLMASHTGGYETGEPLAYIYYPVFDTYRSDKRVVAVLMLTVYWRSYFQDLLTESTKGIYCVVENNFGQVFTYMVNGKQAKYLGMDDLHDEAFDHMVIASNFKSFLGASLRDGDIKQYTGVPFDDSSVTYRIRVYPSKEMEEDYTTTTPIYFTVAMLLVFSVSIVVFIAYDCFVQRRQQIVMDLAERSGAVLSSLFPGNVKDRLMEEANGVAVPGKNRLKNFLSGSMSNGDGDARSGDFDDEDLVYKSKPIADLFPATTVMMADMVGFTAWSSTREPAQVFTLLESVYRSFDDIAARRGVFKVETVGDCYVAVCGLPDPNPNHAVVMARFAFECLRKMQDVVKRLEVRLGPDTGDLSMRFGLHSGPVTAGVLRGERSRFQLFGDTVNTAARFETTGQPGKIHLSEETANLLVRASKSHWIVKREQKVYAKGKGELQGYWLIKTGGSVESSTNSSETPRSSGGSSEADRLLSVKTQNLIAWSVETMIRILREVVARREQTISPEGATNPAEWSAHNTNVPLEEVTEIICLPEFDAAQAKRVVNPENVKIDANVVSQLREFVTCLASLYKPNHFHNFEHASHVTMSVLKLLSRIVAPSEIDYEGLSTEEEVASSLHDHTYGITSDPLVQFACVFSALIHDADHEGLPNAQLVKEGCATAKVYNNRSVAEQHSVDLVWELLMSDNYVDLRTMIATTKAEVRRFRELVVNMVMATDIMDKDLKTLRNTRWEKAFHEQKQDFSPQDIKNRKATIVLEHLIQASDIAHTMQHWHVYRKWNERLFREMRKAFRDGRSEKDPADFWYKGELGFFDFYIIPLAKKLSDCGVFGVSSDEYLQWAQQNRKEWEMKGQTIVAEMIQEYDRQWGTVEEANVAVESASF